MIKRLDPAQIDSDPNREIWTAKQAVEAGKQRAAKAKPGSEIWIQAGKTRAKTKGSRIEEPLGDGLYLLSPPTKDGQQSWTYRYRRPSDGKAAKLTLGKVDTNRKLEPGEEPDFDDPEGLTKDMAVTLASWCRVQVKNGRDPAAVKEQRRREFETLQRQTWEGHTFDELVVRFMENYPLIRGRKARDSSKAATAGHLGLKWDKRTSKWVPTGNGVLKHWQGKIFCKRDKTPVIDKAAAYTILEDKRDTPITANRTQSALRLFGEWCEDRSYVSVNPFATLKRLYEAKQRWRILTDDEIQALWQIVETAKPHEAIGYPYGKAALLGLILAQRPGEIREAAWAEFDLTDAGTWTIPAARTKTDAKHTVPLSQMARELLASLPVRGKYLFMAEGSNNPVHKQSRVSARLLQRVGKAVGRDYASEPDATKDNRYSGKWTLHDLRHTAYSGITALGFTSIIADKVTNHAAEGMAKVYDQHDYLAEKREALDKWAKRLEKLIAAT
ncbi:tyrosine-type recombinase/integrase [Sinorhizobium fredii]|uniref:tyrosine-type recombinase/integrase n=1 Tax=Rhizobium fredii TaxID=380 RepID=UPI0004B41A75|nr:site-specific integrase [Sinorhizobium fredii]